MPMRMGPYRDILQAIFTIFVRHPRCRRAICLRNRRCVPPAHPGYPGLFRCPFDVDTEWLRRVEAAQVFIKRRMKSAEKLYADKGRPSPFAPPPVPGPFDLGKRLDMGALLMPLSRPAPAPETEED